MAELQLRHILRGLAALVFLLHLLVCGRATFLTLRGLLMRLQQGCRRVVARLAQARCGDDSNDTAFKDAVRQEVAARRIQVWGKACYIMATTDLICASLMTRYELAAATQIIVLMRWAVILVGARYTDKFGTWFSIGCYMVIMSLNTAFAVVAEDAVHPRVVLPSILMASCAILSPVVIPCHASVVAGVLIGKEVRGAEGISGSQPFVFLVPLMTLCLSGLVTWIATEEATLKVQSGSFSALASAVRSVLDAVCDAVVELDEKLAIVRHENKLAALLMRSPNVSLENTYFPSLMLSDVRKLAFEQAALAEADGAAVATSISHLAMCDSSRQPVQVEILRVPFKPLLTTHYLVGIRETLDGRSSRFAEGEAAPRARPKAQGPPARPQPSRLGSFSDGSSTPSSGSCGSRLSSRRRGLSPASVGASTHRSVLQKTLATDAFATKGFVIKFDSSFNVIHYVAPHSGVESPGCGDTLTQLMPAADAANARFFEAHGRCCTKLMDSASKAGQSKRTTTQFESKWMLRSCAWSDEALRAKVQVRILAQAPPCVEAEDGVPTEGVIMTAKIMWIEMFKLKPKAFLPAATKECL